MRRHGSLTKDKEVNAAAWEAGKGAVTGAATVSRFASALPCNARKGYIQLRRWSCRSRPHFME